jgi:hypothetical protein
LFSARRATHPAASIFWRFCRENPASSAILVVVAMILFSAMPELYAMHPPKRPADPEAMVSAPRHRKKGGVVEEDPTATPIASSQKGMQAVAAECAWRAWPEGSCA